MLRAAIAHDASALIPWVGTAQVEPHASTEPQTVIDGLLHFPAPTPRSANEGRSKNARFSWNSPPSDDAPLDVLALYWGQIDYSTKASASSKTREQLLKACVEKPEFTASLLKILPQTPEAHDIVKRLYDENADPLREGWRDGVKKYLKLNTKYFREELVADALAAKDDAETGSVTNEDELATLARLDWAKAEPILKRFATDPMPRRAVCGCEWACGQD